MAAIRLDSLARSLSGSSSRRDTLRLLAGSVFAILATRLRFTRAGATHFGCLHWKERCSSGDECCSGVCKRKTCRAPNRGRCRLGHNFCAGGKDKRCKPGCLCNTTTGNAPHCGKSAFCPAVECLRDADCGVLGAACIPPVNCQGCGSPATKNFCQFACGS
jgi:hypothetical protein